MICRLLLIAIGLFSILPSARAAVLCKTRSSTVKLRDACRKRETPVDLSEQIQKLAPGLSVASASNAANANALEGKPASAFAASASEPFHEIGAPGEPVFENGWQNQAVAGRSSAAFYKDPLGVVHLKGIIVGPDGLATAFTLPPGYRPSQDLVVPKSSSAVASLVATTGEVQVECQGGSCTHGLDGFTFRAQ